MTTIDFLINTIILPENEQLFTKGEWHSLTSFANSLSNVTYLTKKQADFILTFLKKHSKKVSTIDPSVTQLIENPVWDRPFREIIETRSVKIETRTGTIGLSQSTVQVIKIEFSHYSKFLKSLLIKITESKSQSRTNSVSSVIALTEQNIVTVVDALLPHNFNIDPVILNYYNEIMSWNKDDYVQKFTVQSNQHIQSKITQFDTSNQLLLNDNRIRYQLTNVKKVDDTSLTAYIANRDHQKLWIDKCVYTLTDIFKSLQELNRSRVLVVFSNNSSTPVLTSQFNELINAMESVGITSNVGCYFRLTNNMPDCYAFNKMIADRKYNSDLDSSTKVACIINDKMPKFLFKEKNNWYPDAIISVDHVLRYSRVAFYTNNCDLIMTYRATAPLIEPR